MSEIPLKAHVRWLKNWFVNGHSEASVNECAREAERAGHAMPLPVVVGVRREALEHLAGHRLVDLRAGGSGVLVSLKGALRPGLHPPELPYCPLCDKHGHWPSTCTQQQPDLLEEEAAPAVMHDLAALQEDRRNFEVHQAEVDRRIDALSLYRKDLTEEEAQALVRTADDLSRTWRTDGAEKVRRYIAQIEAQIEVSRARREEQVRRAAEDDLLERVANETAAADIAHESIDALPCTSAVIEEVYRVPPTNVSATFKGLAGSPIKALFLDTDGNVLMIAASRKVLPLHDPEIVAMKTLDVGRQRSVEGMMRRRQRLNEILDAEPGMHPFNAIVRLRDEFGIALDHSYIYDTCRVARELAHLPQIPEREFVGHAPGAEREALPTFPVVPVEESTHSTPDDELAYLARELSAVIRAHGMTSASLLFDGTEIVWDFTLQRRGAGKLSVK